MKFWENEIQQLSRDVFLNVDIKGNIKNITANCFNLIGYMECELIGKNISCILQNETLDSLIDKNKELKNISININIARKDGSYMYADLKVYRLKTNMDDIFISMIDVTKYHQEVKKSERIMRIFEKSDDIICSFNIKGEHRFDYLSSSIFKNLGTTVGEHIDNPMLPLEVVHPDDYELHLKKFQGKVDYNQRFETRFRHKNGNYIWFEEHINPIWDENNELVAMDCVVRNIQERKELEEKLKYLSYRDSLTGLFNRLYFEERKNVLNKEDKPVSIVICDIDNLKPVNDNFGHKLGDELIKNVSNVISDSISGEGEVIRIGGDEFCIIIENKKYDDIEDLVCKIKTSIEKYNKKDTAMPIEISIGFKYSSTSFEKMEDIFKEADTDMYTNKQIKKKLLK